MPSPAADGRDGKDYVDNDEDDDDNDGGDTDVAGQTATLNATSYSVFWIIRSWAFIIFLNNETSQLSSRTLKTNLL